MSTEMAAEGSKSTQKYNYLTKEIDRIMEEMKKMDSQIADKASTTPESNREEQPQIQLQDPDIAQTKGRQPKSNKRAMPLVENFKQQKKQKYNCRTCKVPGHNSSTCPTNNANTSKQKK